MAKLDKHSRPFTGNSSFIAIGGFVIMLFVILLGVHALA